jgi:hypothetical protein
MDEAQSSGWAAGVKESDLADDAGERRMNALAGAASAYLRSAMHQPVAWMEWGEAAFDRALQEDKPILLDIGAVWCHWCHVMDRPSWTAELPARAADHGRGIPEPPRRGGRIRGQRDERN